MTSWFFASRASPQHLYTRRRSVRELWDHEALLLTNRRGFDLPAFLENVFCRHVDLVTEKGLKPRARLYVERDLIRVA
jgi:hypothetical protein